MKYKNKIQNTRKKFLQQKPLSEKEQEIIDKDFRGKDYTYYESIKDNPILLAEKYSAETTFRRIEPAMRTGKPQLPILKYAAAIALLVITTFGLYQLNKTPENIRVSTSYGEKKQITLPDGSSVIMNSLSSLSYPKNIHKANIREVKLEGEAYFEVTSNKKSPFIVNASETSVKVLGTKFNVSAYLNDDNITTSLYEGSVSVSFESGNSIQLNPGEQAIYNKKNRHVRISEIEDDSQNAWIKGSMYFENISLEDIFRILEREKNITFKISDNVNKELKLTAKFNHNESIEEMLEHLSRAGGFTFEQQDNTYLINKQKH